VTDANPIFDQLLEEERLEREKFKRGRKANGHDEKRDRRIKEGRTTVGSLGPLWRAIRALRYVKAVEENFGIVAAALVGTRQEGAEEVFKAWTGQLANEDKARASRVWERISAACGEKPAAAPEGIYRLAFAAGWRWPIVFNANRLDEMAEEAEHQLVRAGADIYQLDDRLVRPVLSGVSAANNRKAAVAQLLPVTLSYMQGQLAKYIDWGTLGKQNNIVDRGVDKDLVRLLLEKTGDWKEFRPVAGVIMTPTLRPNGTLLVEQGYDPETELILMRPPEIPSVPETPSRNEGLAAIRRVAGLFDEFAFKDEASRAVALSDVVTAVVRPSCVCVPAHAVNANQAGSGKSFLKDTAAAVALGDLCPVISEGDSDAERDKTINAELLKGTPYWSLDNLMRPMRGAILCHAIERPIIDIRIFRTLETRRVRNTACIGATGNNLQINGDVTRRVLRCDLETKMENPLERVFTRNPITEATKNRGRYIADVLTAVRAYRVAGCPDVAPGIGEPFDAWNRYVRSMLIWYGYADPAATLRVVRAEDQERLDLTRLFRVMAEVFGASEPNLTTTPSIARTTGEIAGLCNRAGGGPLWQILLELAPTQRGDQIDSSRLGKSTFRMARGQIAGGLRLRGETDKHSGQQRWWIEHAAPIA
jgi:putative DNA primase/helicase